MKPTEENRVGPACGSQEMARTSFQIWLRWRGKKGQFADADSNRLPVSATSAISCSPSGHTHPRVVLVFLHVCAQGQESVAYGSPAANKSVQDKPQDNGFNLESVVFIISKISTIKSESRKRYIWAYTDSLMAVVE
ncbi:hypothetical protein Pyn_25190 [Prunus yedoensis var. nudiflora]|uniref:Uncharacterized protein n=1 Tax=Prunus yedoensis var. nudiflora TaxID=2094558 RepID=A0A314UYW7_PRUYE|nr:hypothetical protein Pyn_25190 [Prunus yedoensis var. nudiflora]